MEDFSWSGAFRALAARCPQTGGALKAARLAAEQVGRFQVTLESA